MEFIKPGTNIDFVGKRYIAAAISFIAVIVSIYLFFFGPGPNWGIDFTGGTEIVLQFDESITIGEVRDALEQLEVSNDAVQQIGAPEDNEYVIRIQDPEFGTEGVKQDVEQALKAEFGDDWIKESSFDAQIGARVTVRYKGDQVPITRVQDAVSGIEGARAADALDDHTVYVNLPGLSSKIADAIKGSMGDRAFEVLKVDSVGPKVGGQLRRNGFISLGATLLLVLVYVGFRFDLSFAPGAVIALFHDVTIVSGIFVITQHEFNLPVIGALLTIIGYSLNDTIVIYDRIRENMTKYRRRQLPQLINDSINETLARTINTSLTTGVAMLAFIFIGGPVIQTFALAILLGVLTGTYSTVFVASPTILVMEDVKPQLTKVFGPGLVKNDGDESRALTETERRRQARSGGGGTT